MSGDSVFIAEVIEVIEFHYPNKFKFEASGDQHTVDSKTRREFKKTYHHP